MKNEILIWEIETTKIIHPRDTTDTTLGVQSMY